jgi:stalled ribosome rescue protein Dom34
MALQDRRRHSGKGAGMMAQAYHVIVWIDHRVAYLYGVTRTGIDELFTIYAPDQDRGHIHHKAGSIGSGHVAVAPAFLREVAVALGKAQEILIVGPADAKDALKKYIGLQIPLLAERIRGVEPMGRAGKEEIHTFAVRFFRQHDLMGPA